MGKLWRVVSSLLRGMLYALIASISLFLLLYAFSVVACGQENLDFLNPPHVHGQNGIPDWYDALCCNNRDCHPVDPDAKQWVEEVDEGAGPNDVRYRYHDDMNGVIGLYYNRQILPSKDGRFHVCHTNPINGTYVDLEGVKRFSSTYCMYIPTTAELRQ